MIYLECYSDEALVKALGIHKREIYHSWNKGNVCKRLEDWILKAAKDAKVNVEDYSLPDDTYELHKIINIKLDKFVQLIGVIRKRSKMLKTLEKMIKR